VIAPARQRWVLATGNPGKVAEFRALLEPASIELLPLADFGVAGPAETAATFVENALLKARHASQATGLPAIAEDSGLVVPALGGEPGIRSARYAGDDASDDANVDKLLAALAGRADRAAAFLCVVVALRTAADPAPVIAEGRWDGAIATARRGRHGFAYDPVFVDAATGRTAAELTAAEKNARSHRGRAARLLVAALTAAPVTH